MWEDFRPFKQTPDTPTEVSQKFYMLSVDKPKTHPHGLNGGYANARNIVGQMIFCNNTQTPDSTSLLQKIGLVSDTKFPDCAANTSKEKCKMTMNNQCQQISKAYKIKHQGPVCQNGPIGGIERVGVHFCGVQYGIRRFEKHALQNRRVRYGKKGAKVASTL